MALLRKRFRRTSRPPHVPPRPPASQPTESGDGEGAQGAPADRAGLTRKNRSKHGKAAQATPPAPEPPRPGYAVSGLPVPQVPLEDEASAFGVAMLPNSIAWPQVPRARRRSSGPLMCRLTLIARGAGRRPGCLEDGRSHRRCVPAILRLAGRNVTARRQTRRSTREPGHARRAVTVGGLLPKASPCCVS